MADTAATLIKDSLGEISVSAAEYEPTGEMLSSGIRFLNRMMTSWASNGLSLGYTVVTGPSDSITVPDGALDGIMTNLALRLAPRYDAQVTPELALAAKDGKAAIRKIAVTVTATSHPCTLPIGSGNEDHIGGPLLDKFYACPEDTVLTEEGGNVQLESGT
jgi:hypothetical protein